MGWKSDHHLHLKWCLPTWNAVLYNMLSLQQVTLWCGIEQQLTDPHATKSARLLGGKCKFKPCWEGSFTGRPEPFALGSSFKFSDIAVNLERKHMETRWHISQTAKQILRGFREHVLPGVSTATWWSWWLTFVLHLYAEERRHDHSSVSCFHTGARFPAMLEWQMLLANAF